MWSVVKIQMFLSILHVFFLLCTLYLCSIHTVSLSLSITVTYLMMYIYIMVSQLTQTMLGDICRRQRKVSLLTVFYIHTTGKSFFMSHTTSFIQPDLSLEASSLRALSTSAHSCSTLHIGHLTVFGMREEKRTPSVIPVLVSLCGLAAPTAARHLTQNCVWQLTQRTGRKCRSSVVKPVWIGWRHIGHSVSSSALSFVLLSG